MSEAMWRSILFACLLPACHLGDSGQIVKTCDELPAGCDGLQTDDTGTSPDQDGDGYTADIDCDDSNPLIHPDADEICDTVDNDCDGVIDTDDDSLTDGLTAYFDLDGDGYGQEALNSPVCELSDDLVDNGDDCNDEDASTYPGASEFCDGIDTDCDGANDAAMVTVNQINYETITEAIDAAPIDATIYICDGTWEESIVITQSVTLESVGGAKTTQIVSDGTTAVVEVLDGDVHIQGFTLTGGAGSNSSNIGYPVGGGIYFNGLGLTVSESVIQTNTATIGGGVFADGDASSVTIEDTLIESNTADAYCGAIFSYVSLTITNSTISDNSSYWCGGVGTYGSNLQISDSKIQDNIASYSAGGLWGTDSAMTFSNVEISGNQSANDGGGISIDGGSLTCDNSSVIQSNIAGSHGGGVVLVDAALTDCILEKNTAQFGGGISVIGGTSPIVGMTLLENTAITFGGGIYLESATTSLDNCDLLNNVANYGGGIYVLSEGEMTLLGGSVTGNEAITGVGGGLRLASGEVTGITVDFGDGEEDNTPDDIAILDGSSPVTGLGSGTNFVCSILGSSDGCTF